MNDLCVRKAGSFICILVGLTGCSGGKESDSASDPYADRLPTVTTEIDDFRTFVEIDSDQGIFCATSSTGEVLCMKEHVPGDTGEDPRQIVDDVPETQLEDVSVGWGHACGRDRLGTATTCWGCTESHTDVCGVFAEGWSMVRHMGDTICYVQDGGLIGCVGDAVDESRIDPTEWGDRRNPIALDSGGGLCATWGDGTDCLDEPSGFLDNSIPTDTEFQVLSAGKYHACGVDTDGYPTCWGDDRGYEGLPSERMSQIIADHGQTCFIRSADNSVDCVPTNLHPPEGSFVDVAVYDGHPVAVRDDGVLVEWMLDPAYDTGLGYTVD